MSAPKGRERTIDTSEGGLLAAAGLRDACDLDLLLFFSRHPRVVLRREQLATYVGYELRQVDRALERLLSTGLLNARSIKSAPGRMYVLALEHVEPWLEPLRRVCATPEGRNELKRLLRQRASVPAMEGVDHA